MVIMVYIGWVGGLFIVIMVYIGWVVHGKYGIYRVGGLW